MKKWIASSVLVLALVAGLYVLDPMKANSTTILGNPDPFAITCASGYTRTVPHFCAKNVVVSSVSLTTDGACRTLELDAAIPDNAVYADVTVHATFNSGNAILTRTVNPVFYLTNGCGTNIMQWLLSAREETAVASQVLHVTTFTSRLKIVNGEIYYIADDGVSVITVTLIVMGYYD